MSNRPQVNMTYDDDNKHNITVYHPKDVCDTKWKNIISAIHDNLASREGKKKFSDI